ncbi:MAG TPA: hypothetical protein VIB00_00095, partial [Pyrinomonadaceae bacterium]
MTIVECRFEGVGRLESHDKGLDNGSALKNMAPGTNNKSSIDNRQYSHEFIDDRRVSSVDLKALGDWNLT